MDEKRLGQVCANRRSRPLWLLGAGTTVGTSPDATGPSAKSGPCFEQFRTGAWRFAARQSVFQVRHPTSEVPLSSLEFISCGHRTFREQLEAKHLPSSLYLMSVRSEPGIICTDVIPCMHGLRCAPEAWIYMAGTMHGKSRAINFQRLQSQPLPKRPTKPRSARSGSERLHEGRLGPHLN